MGNQVVVSFLTDHWHETRKDPKKFVQVIDRLLNYGSESLVEEVLARRHGGRSFPFDTEEARWAASHYVTVHRFRHADEQQITYTSRNSSYDLDDFTRGIEIGVLDRKGAQSAVLYLRVARGIVQALRDKADRLESMIRKEEEIMASGLPPEDIEELRRKFG